MHVFFHKRLVSKGQLSYSIYRNIILILSQRGHDNICDIVAGGGEGGVGGDGCGLTPLLAVYLHLPEPGQVIT